MEHSYLFNSGIGKSYCLSKLADNYTISIPDNELGDYVLGLCGSRIKHKYIEIRTPVWLCDEEDNFNIDDDEKYETIIWWYSNNDNDLTMLDVVCNFISYHKHKPNIDIHFLERIYSKNELTEYDNERLVLYTSWGS